MHPRDVQDVKFLAHVRFTGYNCRGLPNPPSCGKPLKGTLAHLSMVCPRMGGGGEGGRATHGNRWLDVVDLLLISVCSIEAGDKEKKTSENLFKKQDVV